MTTTSITKATKSARKVPTGTMAAIAELVPTKGHTYFDPMDTLEDTLGLYPTLLSRVMSSMAWMVDNACIGQARTILFSRYSEQEQNEHVTFDEFCQAISENLSHESLYTTEVGPDDQGTSNERTLAILLSVRNQWHDAAARAASADDTDYKSKSLRQLIEAEKVSAPKLGACENFKDMAKAEGGDDEAEVKRIYDDLVMCNRLAGEQRIANNKALMGTTLEILRTVNGYAAEASRFDELPLPVQRRLTNSALGAITRTISDLATKMANKPIEFTRNRKAGSAATAQLEHVLVTKYAETGELENVKSQTQTDLDANAKRKAACSID